MANDDWASQIPKQESYTPQGEYQQDYGWERGDSIIPEFRDPSVHEMPYDRLSPDRMRHQLSRARNWMQTRQGQMVTGLALVGLVGAIIAAVVMQQRMD